MTGSTHLSTAVGRAGRNPGTGRGLFARLGQIVTANPGKVALGWLLVVGALIAISAALGQPPPSSAVASQLPAGYESVRAQAAIDKAFGAPSSDGTAMLVVSRADGRALTAGDRVVAGLPGTEARHRAAGPQQQRPAAVRVTPVVQLSPNHLVALAQVSFGAQSGTPATGQAVDNVRADVRRALAGTGLRAELTGEAAGEQDNSLTEQLAVYGMLVAIVLLLLVLFRSPGLPFLVVGVVFGVGQGVTALLNIVGDVFGFQLDKTTTNLLPVVLFGVGTDY